MTEDLPGATSKSFFGFRGLCESEDRIPLNRIPGFQGLAVTSLELWKYICSFCSHVLHVSDVSDFSEHRFNGVLKAEDTEVFG